MDMLRSIANHFLPALFLGCAGVAGYVVVWIVGWRVARKHAGPSARFPWRQAVSGALLLGWLLMIVAVTLLFRIGGGQANFHLFRGWREAWNIFILLNWLNVLLNVALFLPLGILLPLAGRRFRRPHWTLLTGFCLSLGIECTQLITKRGAFDVDDIFNNSLGAILGWCLVMAVLSLMTRQRRRLALAYGAFPMLCALAFGGMMGTYYAQEYGNLACAPTYTVNMHGVTVSPRSGLPDFGETAPVYYAAPYDRQSCDAFAHTLLEALGEPKQTNADTKETIYYDQQAAYLQHAAGSFLWVYYLDRTFSYSYHDSSQTPEEAQADRETLEALLAPFGLDIPKAAALTHLGDGSYEFSVEQYRDGNLFYDGSVICTYCSDGRLWRVDNALICATLWGQHSILSTAEALAQLEAGHFQGEAIADYISEGIDAITIGNIALTYQVDSKGYYQPVYVFDVFAGMNFDQIKIPALR